MKRTPKETIKHTTDDLKRLKRKFKLSEHDIQKQIVKYLRLSGWLVICTDVMAALGYITGNKRFAFIRHYKDIGYSKGQPDLIAIKDFALVFIEVKTEKGKQSPEQKEVQQTIINHGFTYYLVRSLEDVENILK